MIKNMTLILSRLKALEGAYAPNTLRSYYSDVQAFVDWSEQRNITPFPLISSNLSNYIEFVQEKYSYSTIRRRISALRRINALLEFEDGTHTEEVYLTIRRAKRSKCLDQKQAVGINHDILVKMIDVQPDTLVGTRNRALLSLRTI
jgi:integrase/recombinase XerD